MPEILKVGELADIRNRWPHKEVLRCRCGTEFRLTPHDSQSGYYDIETRSREAGMQWDTYTESYQVILVPCPKCGEIITKEAPAWWTLSYAVGHKPARRGGGYFDDH